MVYAVLRPAHDDNARSHTNQFSFKVHCTVSIILCIFTTHILMCSVIQTHTHTHTVSSSALCCVVSFVKQQQPRTAPQHSRREIHFLVCTKYKSKKSRTHQPHARTACDYLIRIFSLMVLSLWCGRAEHDVRAQLFIVICECSL